MILGLSHKSNDKYRVKQQRLLSQMSLRCNTGFSIEYRSYNDSEKWRQMIIDFSKTYHIDGIVILDEKVPPVKVHRTGSVPDNGISDNIYGNITHCWEDKNGDGIYDVSEMPDTYTQDAWVCRFVPHNIQYNIYQNWFQSLLAFVNWSSNRSYSYMLDYWFSKMSKLTPTSLSSFMVLNDTSGTPDEQGFPFDMKLIEDRKVFDKILGHIITPDTTPTGSNLSSWFWHLPSYGTGFANAHSGERQLGDMRYDTAFNNLKSWCGPTLLLLNACAVGEWNLAKNLSIVGNIFNSKYNNNIKCICASGLIQWGGSFMAFMDGKGTWLNGKTGENLYTLMRQFKGKTFGDAHKAWINLAYEHYIAMNKLYGERDKRDYKQELINFIAMNITGDATIIL